MKIADFKLKVYSTLDLTEWNSVLMDRRRTTEILVGERNFPIALMLYQCGFYQTWLLKKEKQH